MHIRTYSMCRWYQSKWLVLHRSVQTLHMNTGSHCNPTKGTHHSPDNVLYTLVSSLSPPPPLPGQIGIPATAVRRSERKYEEIVLPADSTVAPMPDLGVEQIKVSSLDEMARTAFQGTKSLNLIQSIVYEQAYHSNENLLICAPTGSGKTNIAMLAVLRELKLHLNSEGGIKKEEFKVMVAMVTQHGHLAV